MIVVSELPLPIAYFARGMDGLFLRPPAGFKLISLVRADCAQSDWLKRWLPTDQVLEFRLKRYRSDPYPSTEELLRGSDITTCLQQNQIKHLMLSSSCSAWMNQWARDQDISLVATDYAMQQTLENKIWFDRFLKRQQLPRPASQIITLGKTKRCRIRGRIVLQRADSLGGEGTFMLEDFSKVEGCLAAGVVEPQEKCLVREFIEGKPYGVTVFVSPHKVQLSAIRLQCYYPPRHGSNRRLFAGIQWSADERLSKRLRGRIRTTMNHLGRALQAKGFYGFANVDFMVNSQDEVFIIECNPRMSAATPQLFHEPSLSYGVDLGTTFIAGFFGRSLSGKAGVKGLQVSSHFQGATLDLIPPLIDKKPKRRCVVHEFQSGVYAFTPKGIELVTPDLRSLQRKNEFGLVSFAQAGQAVQEETTLASIVTQFPLFDESGTMLTACHQLIEHFRYL